MTTPPRFRAWDEANRRMVYGAGLLFHPTLPDQLLIGPQCLCSVLHFEGIESGEFLYSHLLDITDPAHLMQSVGVVDKDGNELYEGDIIEFCLPPKPDSYGSAEYRTPRLYQVLREDHYALVTNGIPPLRGVAHSNLLKSNVSQYAKRVGNVFESPDLLPTESTNPAR